LLFLRYADFVQLTLYQINTSSFEALAFIYAANMIQKNNIIRIKVFSAILYFLSAVFLKMEDENDQKP